MKIWKDKGSEFYNTSVKPWLQSNDKEVHSTHNEEKSVAAEMFIRILQSKIYKYMTSFSKNVYTDKLDDIVNAYNNTYHSSIKIKPAYVKSITYIDFDVDSSDKDAKFEVGDRVRISKYKNILAKLYNPN